MKTLRRIYNTKIGKFILIHVVVILYLIGYLLWCLSRPIAALGHLLMLNTHTAKEHITEWNPSFSLKDLRL